MSKENSKRSVLFKDFKDPKDNMQIRQSGDSPVLRDIVKSQLQSAEKQLYSSMSSKIKLDEQKFKYNRINLPKLESTPRIKAQEMVRHSYLLSPQHLSLSNVPKLQHVREMQMMTPQSLPHLPKFGQFGTYDMDQLCQLIEGQGQSGIMNNTNRLVVNRKITQ